MFNNKVIAVSSTLISLGFILLGFGNIYGALFKESALNRNVLSPLTTPKVAKVEHSSFRLDPTAFSYERPKQVVVSYKSNSIGIESAKLMGTVVGASKSEHVAFVTLPNSSNSTLVKVGDKVMGHTCLDITQHQIIFENSPDDFTLQLSGFGTEKLSNSSANEPIVTMNVTESIQESEITTDDQIQETVHEEPKKKL